MAVSRRKQSSEDESWLIAYADMITNLLIFFVALLSAAKLSNAKFQEVASSLSGQTQMHDLAAIKKGMDDHIQNEGLKKVLETSLNEEGLRLSINSGVVFKSGRAQIEKTWHPVIKKALEAMMPYKEHYRIAVEGHTDERPFSKSKALANYRSNWHLASERALNVRAFLEDIGFERNRLQVESYADTVPIESIKVQELNNSERLAMHRRVIIRVF